MVRYLNIEKKETTPDGNVTNPDENICKLLGEMTFNKHLFLSIDQRESQGLALGSWLMLSKMNHTSGGYS